MPHKPRSWHFIKATNNQWMHASNKKMKAAKESPLLTQSLVFTVFKEQWQLLYHIHFICNTRDMIPRSLENWSISHQYTHLPSAVRSSSVQFEWPFWVRAMFVVALLRDLWRMACNSPCGAISIVMALAGICCDASSKRTVLSRLLVWYSAEECVASGVFHALWGTEELTQRADRGFGCGISYTEAIKIRSEHPNMHHNITVLSQTTFKTFNCTACTVTEIKLSVTNFAFVLLI